MFWRVSKDHKLGFERITGAEYLAMGHLPGCRKRLKPKRTEGGRRSGSAVSHAQDDWTRSGDADGVADPDLPLFEIIADELEDLPEPGCAPGCQHRKRYQGNIHPCLTPIALTEYLARLILPPPRLDGQPRRLLVPFAGSGSEVIGALLAGWESVIGIEVEATYCEIAAARIPAWIRAEAEQAELFG